MSSLPLASLLDVELQSGKPPILRAEATSDPANRAAEHRDAVRAVVAAHGSLLVRGLNLRDPGRDHRSFRGWPPGRPGT
jgi:hypothetical protein